MQVIRKLIKFNTNCVPQSVELFKNLKRFNELINKYLLEKLTIILIFGIDIIYFKYE